MSCITEILKVKGDRDYLRLSESDGTPWITIEGGGIYKDYEYLVTFTPLGHRCGYVAISTDHPTYNDPSEYPSFLVHGGVTFFGKSLIPEGVLKHSCEDKWIGFDCMHGADMPDIKTHKKYYSSNHFNDSYINTWKEIYSQTNCKIRSFKYVEKECFSLINQLREVSNG